MDNKLNLTIFFSLMIGLMACDTIDDPIPKDVGADINYNDVIYVVEPSLGVGNVNGLLDLIDNNNWTEVDGIDNSAKRLVVIEEFTGHKCVFCPLGTKELIRLDSLNDESVIPVSIHGGAFALPSPGNYASDYRVLPHSEVYVNEFFGSTSGYPAAMISRLGGEVDGRDNWGILLDSIKNDAPIAELRIKNYYSGSSNLLRVRLNIRFLQAPTAVYNLQVYIKEDNIIDYQDDILKGDIPNYNHRFMLRKVVNGTFGRALEGIGANEEFEIEYILPLESSWKPDDVSSIAFIFNSDPDSYEIIQGNVAKIK